VTSMEYSYRHSALSERHVVLEAKLRLVHKKPDAVRSRVEEFRRHRAATQPGALQNAGSVFKNPPGDHAGRLVEAAGLKGLTVGGARVSELHANFFIAGAGATAADVHALVHEVRQRVLAEFGVELTPEIKFVGDFGALADHGVAR
jgi:UDP-N-acetylmuramate dehydrogenase